MSPPSATYRLQFRHGMTFERAADLADYLARLGISHLYSSPLFAAAPGSTHGYDGIDFGAIEPAIGGEVGFERLCASLEKAGLGLLLDFVPNHMAATDANSWWRDVLEWGAISVHAATFDIDWSAPKLMLPILGAAYGDALVKGAFGITFDAAAGSLSFTCYDRHLPINPPSYETVLARAGEPAVAELARQFAAATVSTAGTLKRHLAEQAATPARAAAIAEAVSVTSTDPALLHEIHEQQIWRLCHWRLAREALTYRRFFEIAELVCLRIEDPIVFDAVHARLFELINAGRLAGVRLDHIDGLADPKGYLKRLQERVCGDGRYYVLVEKILDRDEALRPDWPIAGTTGYEFITALSDLFVDRRREAAMRRAYDAFTATKSDYGNAARAAKREILEHNLVAELGNLTTRAVALAARDIGTRDLGADTLRRAIVELVAAFPVYRSYVTADGPDEAARSLIIAAAREAKASRVVEDTAAIDFLANLLLLNVARPGDREAALAFATRFQQTTGPVMAKAVEDTMFYRWNRLIALNEVGGSPDRYGAPVSVFHQSMMGRQRSQPHGLSTTSTHDTKRGEDARARIYVLSEMPDGWRRAVARWAKINAAHRSQLPDGPAPEPAIEWLFYQALVGAWPADLVSAEPSAEVDTKFAAFARRMRAFMEKAVREAKLRTNWTNPDPGYEAAVADFVAAVLSPDAGLAFRRDLLQTCRPVWRAGAINALAQLVIKLAAPGIPDVYQGSELWDLSMVDPDNRAPVDFARRQEALQAAVDSAPAALLDDWTSGTAKLRLIATGLRARAERATLFRDGHYVGLATTGARARNAVAFARTLERSFALAVAPRLVLGLIPDTAQPIVPAERWADTSVKLPPALRGRSMRDAVTGVVHKADRVLRIADVLERFPVAILVDAD